MSISHLRRRSIALVALLAFVLLAGAGSSVLAQQSTPMRYFRYPSQAACNVYMNYSFWQPNYSLMARDPGRLTAEERAFMGEFNARFQAMAVRGGAGDCEPPSGGMYSGNARDIYQRCMATQDRFGISEEGWVGGRMPAPSNCISPKRARSGVVYLINGSLPTPPMTLDQWIRRSESGQ